MLPITFFFTYPAWANNYSEINYTITPRLTDDVPYIKVAAEIKGEITDKVIVDFPHKWAMVKNYFAQIKNIKLENLEGKIEFKKKQKYQGIITLPKKCETIRLSYEVHQKLKDPADVHETIVRKNLVHTTGYGIFVVPHELKEIDTKVHFSITWQDLPEEWHTISSFSTDKSFKFIEKTDRLLHAIYAAGNIRIVQISKDKRRVLAK